ncbi:Smr/MutS family protein [Mycoplasma leonicaptivi]|uniref:Smr/MutS family protein n=1 Tax=Mycoplasma leonicaptivi TaxID=36742 RepID=UPI000565A216|nr:Smr/MutS family protein [Mycoplasma leonicaptivi]
MNKTVDLHGLEVYQATPKIQIAILELVKNKYNETLIITGKGTGALQTEVERLIKNHNLTNNIKINYDKVNNNGAYYLYISNNFDYTYDFEHKEISKKEINALFELYKK